MKKKKPKRARIGEPSAISGPSPYNQNALAWSDIEPPDAKESLEHHADRFLIHVRALNEILVQLEDRQVSPDLLGDELARHKLNDRELDALDGFVSMNRFARFLQSMSELLNKESLGLDCVSFRNGGEMGVLGGAVAAAPNFAASVGALTRYMSLYADLSYISFTVDDERAQFAWSYSPLLIERRALCDRSARLFVIRAQHLFDDEWLPLSVQLEREKPVDVTPYQRALGPNLTFDAPLNVIEFSASDLHLENRYGNKSAFELAVALAERMMSERRVPDDLSIRVREDVLNHLDEGALTAGETARRLGLSTRVLQRRLARLGTSYQRLCDSIRLQLARELLIHTGIPMSEIAFRLGFSNQANLTRAVKRWFGVSPRAFREQNR